MGGRGSSSKTSGAGQASQSAPWLGKYEEYFGDGSKLYGSDLYNRRLIIQGLNDHPLQYFVDRYGAYGTATVMDDVDFDAYVEKRIADGTLKSDDVMYRGMESYDDLPASDMAAQLMYGDKYYIGNGVHGDGTYFSNRVGTAASYAKGLYGGSIVRGVLKPDAKVVSETVLDKEIFENDSLKVSGNSAFSSYALSRGFDAVTVGEENGEVYTVVLNRSAVVFSKGVYSHDGSDPHLKVHRAAKSFFNG